MKLGTFYKSIAKKGVRHYLKKFRQGLMSGTILTEFKEPKDLIISLSNIDPHNGLGILLNSIFDFRACVNIHSRHQRPDKSNFKSYYVDARGKSRPAIYSLIQNVIAKENIRRIICIPFFKEDYLVGIAVKHLLDIPLVVWVMDDSILHKHPQVKVPYKCALELFELADIRFVISPEMRDAYEITFQHKFYMLPPTVQSSLIKQAPRANISATLPKKTCAIIGHIYHETWLEKLLQLTKKTGWTIDWYPGRISSSQWLKTPPEELRKHNIIEKGFFPQKELAGLLLHYPFVIVPTGCGTEKDELKGATFLSLSSRIPFILATSNVPLLVIGNEKSCVANFVRRFGIGLCIDYEENQFLTAIAKFTDEAFLMQCYNNAAVIADLFSDQDLAEWIWESCDKGSPIDDRFEQPFRRQSGTFAPYIEETAPKDLYKHLQPTYNGLLRLAQQGYQPDFVIDVGASSGIWSDTAYRIFPLARFILLEPLATRYDQGLHQKHPQFEWVIAAASNENGKSLFQVSNDFYGSSLLPGIGDHRNYQSVECLLTTLDTILIQKEIRGRGILKIDVQHAEHIVLEGASTLLEQVDVLILELTLRPPQGIQTFSFVEMVNEMESLGFHYYDDVGEWRCPVRGTLEEKDVLFVKQPLISRLSLL